MLESVIKSKSRDLLEADGWFVIHLIQTNVNGIPDTLALKLGKAMFIEFKQQGLEPDPLQKYRIGQLKAVGFKTIVIDTVQDTKNFIEREHERDRLEKYKNL
jgi:hypothetical protein